MKGWPGFSTKGAMPGGLNLVQGLPQARAGGETYLAYEICDN